MQRYHDDNIVFLIDMNCIKVFIGIEDGDKSIKEILMGVWGRKLFVINDMLFIKINFKVGR
jgi:hypothetical protein